MNRSVEPDDLAAIVERVRPIAPLLAGRTVVMSGARGFLGRYFMEVVAALNERLLDAPCRFIGLDNLITAGALGAREMKAANVSFVRHDIIKPLEIDEHVDYVIHAAGLASPFYYRAYPLETLDVATIGTRNMLDLADRKRARFLFLSSCEIYGDPDPKHVPIQESYRGNVAMHGPRACYDESKRLGETLCYVYHNKFGTSTNCVRPFNVFGPGMQQNDYRVMSNFAACIQSGKPLQVYGSGRQTRTFCYVVDAMVGFLFALVRGVPGEAYNIGNPAPEISILELARRMEVVLGRPVEVNTVEYPDSYPADEPQRRCPDIRKAMLDLEFAAEISLDDGLRRFLRWTERNYTATE